MAVKDISDVQVCLAVRRCCAAHYAEGYPYELLARETGHPEKVCYRAMERAEKHGYLMSGVSLRTAWLTEAGEQLIAGHV